MKIPEQRSFPIKKLAVISLAVVLLIVATAGVYVYGFGGTLFGWPAKQEATKAGKINYDKPTDDQKKAGEEVKKSTTDGAKPNVGGSDQTPAPVPQSNGKAKVELDITNTSQSNGTLHIGTLISATTASGTCTLTLTSGTKKPVTKTAAVQALPSNATCKGFDIPVSELVPGNWQAALHFENDTLTGDTTRGIVIQ
jgi:hypothetical protein